MAEARHEQSKSDLMESELLRLQRQNDALLAERVDLYMKMQKLESQLSTATTESDNMEKQLMAVLKIPSKLDQISSQAIHSLLPCATLDEHSPRVIYLQGVRQIACGSKHVLALCDTGYVYAWGSGNSGQLGLGTTKSYASAQLVSSMMRMGDCMLTNIPKLCPADIPASDSERLTHDCKPIPLGVRQICAGDYHSAAITFAGLYTWGSSREGQLGHGNHK